MSDEASDDRGIQLAYDRFGGRDVLELVPQKRPEPGRDEIVVRTLAAALNPKPRNYSDKAWQAATKDEDIAKAITGGGPAVGLSALMPPNPDLVDKPMVVQALVDKIRSFAQ